MYAVRCAYLAARKHPICTSQPTAPRVICGRTASRRDLKRWTESDGLIDLYGVMIGICIVGTTVGNHSFHRPVREPVSERTDSLPNPLAVKAWTLYRRHLVA